MVLTPLLFQLVFLALVAFVERQHAIEAQSVLELSRAEDELDDLLARLSEAESAMRGYVLTGNLSFVATFDEAQRLFSNERRTLDRYRSPAADAFQNDAERFFEFHRINRQLIAGGRRDAAVARIGRLEGKRLMDSARLNANEVIAEERRMQLELSRRSHRSRMMMLASIGAGTAVNVLVAVLMGGFFGASITRRLEHIVENTRRLERNDDLVPLDGDDEFAVLDGEYRRVASALVERTERAEAVNRELEAFSYSVSHDLRAPLRAIGGYARLLAEDYAPRLEGEGAHFLDVIRLEADRMGRLIDDLLDLSRVTSRALRYHSVDLASRVAAEVQRLRIGEPDREVEVIIGDLPRARGDAEMIGRVVANLIGNAWKYSRGRRPARIGVDGHCENGMSFYSVQDNGVGFDMRYAEKLFLVFERLHAGNEFEGTGIGLAIVERIVTRHGGKVWAEGEPGVGATFYFTLPAEEESQDVR
ncbi:MAG TPA: ATP-binding protein [Thermoanaerobaculia bacterium]|nr:ATP-binding protein [Thermoanaerobaculia bacterium]